MLAQMQGLADTNRGLMGVVLIGPAELLPRLGAPIPASGGSPVPVRIRLDPLAEDETAGYVLHRLLVAGAGRVPVEFNDAALALVYEISRGVPQLVNLLCDRALARGFGASAALIDAPLVASAARNLDLRAPGPAATRMTRTVWMAVGLISLILLGAAVGAFFFRAQLRRAIANWTSSSTQSEPAVPLK